MRKQGRLLAAISLLLIWAAQAWTQQGEPRPGVPSSPGSEETRRQGSTSTNPPAGQESSQVQTTPALSGAEKFSPGNASEARSYLLPTFEWTEFADSNPTQLTGLKSFAIESTLVGSLTLQRVRRRSQLNLDYAGGEQYYAGPLGRGASRYGTFQRLDVLQSHAWRRWKVFVRDSFTYLPESALGFQGFSGLGSFGSGLGGGLLSTALPLNPTFEQNQTILTGRNRSLSNVALLEAQHTIGGRSTITATASYGTLRYLGSNFQGNRYWIGQVGYNHAISPRNFVSVFYAGAIYQFEAGRGHIINHGAQFAFGRQLTNRFSLEISGGPGVTRGGGGLPLGQGLTNLYWSTYDTLQYRFRKGNAELSFSRAVNGGSGALFGGDVKMAILKLGRQLSPKVYGSLNFDYALNQSLGNQSPAPGRSKFKVWVATAALSRELGPKTSLYINYAFQRQIASNPLCFAGHCGPEVHRHIAGFGFNWHGRPVRVH